MCLLPPQPPKCSAPFNGREGENCWGTIIQAFWGVCIPEDLNLKELSIFGLILWDHREVLIWCDNISYYRHGNNTQRIPVDIAFSCPCWIKQEREELFSIRNVVTSSLKRHLYRPQQPQRSFNTQFKKQKERIHNLTLTTFFLQCFTIDMRGYKKGII